MVFEGGYAFPFPFSWEVVVGVINNREIVNRCPPSQLPVGDKLVACSACSFPAKRKSVGQKVGARPQRSLRLSLSWCHTTTLQSFNYRPNNPQLGDHFTPREPAPRRKSKMASLPPAILRLGQRNRSIIRERKKRKKREWKLHAFLSLDIAQPVVGRTRCRFFVKSMQRR